jgi:hypothetical protein
MTYGPSHILLSSSKRHSDLILSSQVSTSPSRPLRGWRSERVLLRHWYWFCVTVLKNSQQIGGDDRSEYTILVALILRGCSWKRCKSQLHSAIKSVVVNFENLNFWTFGGMWWRVKLTRIFRSNVMLSSSWYKSKPSKQWASTALNVSCSV